MFGARVDFRPAFSMQSVLRGVYESADDTDMVNTLCESVAALCAERQVKEPGEVADEREIVQPYIQSLLAAVRQAAVAMKLNVLEVFREATNNEKKRPDFVLVRQGDRAPGPFANCTYVEGKRPGGDMPTGVLQVLYHIGHQHGATSCVMTHGLGVVTDGRDCIFIRVEFHGSRAECLLSRPLPLWNGRGEAGMGLRGLVRLMCDTEPTHYGLPDFRRLPDFVTKKYLEKGFLGAGICGLVYAVEDRSAPPAVDAEELACKVPRPDSPFCLELEQMALRSLGENGVPRVPTIVQAIVVENVCSALVTKPVGTPLMRFLNTLVREEFTEALATMFKEVMETLREAHRARVYHGDIRPPNILHVEGQGFFLIDWGFAKASKGPTPGDLLVDVGNGRSQKEKNTKAAHRDFLELALTWLRAGFAEEMEATTPPSPEREMEDDGGEGGEGQGAAGGGRHRDATVSEGTPSSSASASGWYTSSSPWGEGEHAGDPASRRERRARWWGPNWERVQASAAPVDGLLGLLEQIKNGDEEWLQTRHKRPRRPESNASDADSRSSKRSRVDAS